MQIDLYADASIVKRRYRELALLYHPDKNPNNKVAEEYFKILTQGYNILSEPDKKQEYDLMLKNFYDNKTSQPSAVRTKTKQEEVREKLRRHAENRRQEVIQEYLKDEDTLSHKNRLIISILFFVSGILMCYNNWFLNYLNFNIIYILIGSFMFGFGAYMIANITYKRRLFNRAMSIQDLNTVYGPVRLFVVLFLITPAVFLGVMKFTMFIHLTYFYDYTIVKEFEINTTGASYNYEVNGEEISRIMEGNPNKYLYHKKSELRVKFSRINPNISELVTLEEITEESK